VTWRIFVNGVLGVSSTVKPYWVNGGLGREEIGREYLGSTWNGHFAGYIQDFRITKGAARYVENFEPPARLVKTFSGVVTGLDGNPAGRTIVTIPRTSPGVLPWITTSDPTTGEYSVEVPDIEVSRIVLADEPVLCNDIISRVIPG
jgi:hypothetical protein